MRRTTLGLQLLSALAFATPANTLWAQNAQVATAADERWSNEELDNLLAPIALYPDPILAQVLVAATYPDQVLAAQAHVRAFGSQNIDEMPWEISVKAVARYEPVLNLLAEGEDWMTAVGQAYASQPVDVMNAVQRLRVMANAQGNLQSTPQQQVVVEREVIRIVPAEPQIIYVPTYDPAVVYHRPVYVTHAHPDYWSWGVGYPVGVWLTYDVDWWGHRVYHHGWHSYGPRWVVVSRPFIVINPWYVSPRHTVIVVNRGIGYRRWDTNRVRRYSSIHRNVGYDRHDRGFRRDARDVSRDGNRGDNGRRLGPGNADQRVVPLPGAPSRVARGSERENDRGDAARSGAPRSSSAPRSSATPRTSGETARSSNGTWNPRPSRQSVEPTRSQRTETTAPRSNGNSTPRVSAPRAREQSAPRVSAPRGGGQSAPRASAPRGNDQRAPRASAPRASAPRGGGSSAPRASAPRSSGGSEARGSDRGGSSGNSRGSSSGGGSARGSGRTRGN